MAAPPHLLLRFLLLYGALYCSFGLSSPFLPEFLTFRGVHPESLGLLLGAGTAVRLISAPIAGRLADVFGVFRLELSLFAILAAVVSLLYLPAHSLSVLVLVNLTQAVMLAPLAPLSDALALSWSRSARGRDSRSFDYGWVRGAGSAAFIAGVLVAGQVASAWGLASILWLTAAGLLAAGLSARFAPDLAEDPVQPGKVIERNWVALLRQPTFVRMALAAALVLGSHGMHDAFAIIRWSDAGVSPAISSRAVVGISCSGGGRFYALRPVVVGCHRHDRVISFGRSRSGSALGGDGSNGRRDGPGRNRAPAWTYLRAVSPGVHADHCGDGSAQPCRYRAGFLWDDRNRRDDGVVDHGVWLVVFALWASRLLGNGFAVLCGASHHREFAVVAFATRQRRISRSLRRGRRSALRISKRDSYPVHLYCRCH